jgi:hypothetical protein
MKKIDFKNFRMFKDIEQKDTVLVDARRDFADLIYRGMNGIVAHDLALRIYRSEGEVEMNAEEFGICQDIARSGRPIFYDSFMNNVIDF